MEDNSTNSEEILERIRRVKENERLIEYVKSNLPDRVSPYDEIKAFCRKLTFEHARAMVREIKQESYLTKEEMQHRFLDELKKLIVTKY
jgi:hypothetical protein